PLFPSLSGLRRGVAEVVRLRERLPKSHDFGYAHRPEGEGKRPRPRFGEIRFMAREAVVQGHPDRDNQRQRDPALRPRWLREVIGQKSVVQRLGIVLNACKKLKEPLSHILFDGPPGLGKTTFATVLPNELGTSIQMTSGPALSKPADLLPFLTNVEEGSFL